MKKNEEIQQVLSDMYYYLEHGITVGNNTFVFTELDFYSMSRYTPRELASYLLTAVSRSDFPHFAAFYKYLKEFPLTRVVDRSYYRGRPTCFLTNGGCDIPVKKKDFFQTFSILEENKIPTTKNTVMEATIRKAFQLPVFPILELENSQELKKRQSPAYPYMSYSYAKQLMKTRKN